MYDTRPGSMIALKTAAVHQFCVCRDIAGRRAAKQRPSIIQLTDNQFVSQVATKMLL